MRRFACLMVFLGLSACAHAPALTRPPYALAGHLAPGFLFLSGGGPENPAVLEQFVTLAGGRQASIVLIPFAQADGAVDNYRAAFIALGCTSLQTLSANLARDRAFIQEASGIFIEGGEVNRLARAQAPYREALRQAWLQGCLLGGDSAGAMVLGTQFIASGERQDVLTQGYGGLTLNQGLGFASSCVVDPHFTERARFERLYTTTITQKTLGIGIDQQTAATLGPDGLLSCYGVGTVTLMAPLASGGARVQVLNSGSGVALNSFESSLVR
jgi:cyanophycinase